MSRLHAFSSRSRIAWGVLTLLLIVEGIGGVAVLISTFQGAFAGQGEPLAQRLSILAAAVLAWIWVCITLGGSLRARAGWVRGSAITIHVLLFAAGTGVLQLGLASIVVGWILILLAFAGFAAGIIARPSDQPSEENAADTAESE